MKTEEQKNTEAQARPKRTSEQQLAHLDAMFGPGQGAKKERAKLAARIAAAAKGK